MDNNNNTSAVRETNFANNEEEIEVSHPKRRRDSKRNSHSIEASLSSPGARHSTTGEHRSRRSSSSRPSSKSRSPKRDEKAAKRRNSHSGPGAHAEFASPRKSMSGTSKHRSRSPKRDEKSAHRRHGRSGSFSVPGAQAEFASPRKSMSGTSKHRSHSRSPKRGGKSPPRSNNIREIKPGANASAFLSPGERRKSRSTGRNKKHDIGSPPFGKNSKLSVDSEGLPQIGQDEGLVVAAVTVEDEKEGNDGTNLLREQARINEINTATERSRRNEAENQRLREEMEREREERNQEKRNAKKRTTILYAAVLLLLIGVGVSSFFASQAGDSSLDALNENNTDEQKAEKPDPSTSPSSNPSSEPSNVPTNVPLKYKLPSLVDCARIGAGLPIAGEDEMFDRSFNIPMQVSLLEGNDIDPLLPELEIQIEKLLVPDLIGCPRDFFADNVRRLGYQTSSHRQLSVATPIRYVIAKAIVTVTLTDDVCNGPTSTNCSVVNANLDLKVRGEEKIILLAAVIAEIFPNGKDIRPDLELNDPFETIVIGIMLSLDATLAPTVAPTGGGSEKPSGIPSRSPSHSPSFAPVIGPTTLAPTKAPSSSPSTDPSSTPSLAPSSTPPPTAAPQPGVTQTPTSLASATPSISPSESPSNFPSKAPSLTPSAAPTAAPQPGPSPPPTPSPTINPTSSPTNVPSKTPTIFPTIGPSSMPSFVPSGTPSIQASAAPSPVPTSVPTAGPTPSPTAPAPTVGTVPLLNTGMRTEQKSDIKAYLPARLALDGDYGTYCHTTNKENGQWWRVFVSEYYGQTVTVKNVTVWNRPDDCGSVDCPARIKGAVLELYGAGNSLLATSSPFTRDLVQTFEFGGIGGVVRIHVQHVRTTRQYLHFSEIEAWGNIP